MTVTPIYFCERCQLLRTGGGKPRPQHRAGFIWRRGQFPVWLCGECFNVAIKGGLSYKFLNDLKHEKEAGTSPLPFPIGAGGV